MQDLTGTAPTIPLMVRALEHPQRVAVTDNRGDHTYRDLLEGSARVASGLLGGRADLGEARVAFLVPRGFDYAVVQWGIWRAGGVAVPLCDIHPAAELAYTIEDCGATVVVAHADFEERLRPLAGQLQRSFALVNALCSTPMAPLPGVDPQRRAMVVYTSGTTGKPKGAVTTHRNIEAQVISLVDAWEWRSDDHIVNILPLHHVHGIVVVLTCALWSGARCRMLPKFDAAQVWRSFAEEGVTLFMAVPTVYVKLIEFWEQAPPKEQDLLSRAAGKLRLMVSGSAALPVSVLEKWRRITGQTLLERYGMTEIGMALSNPLNGPRVPGSVGVPLKGVEVRLVDERGTPVAEGLPGEIQVKGPSVFLEYWNRPSETQAAFADGWFCTGDVAVRENGIYRILGRQSTDIIKTGGYKVSALEIEEVLRTHPAVKEASVVGLEDPEWGERVAAGLVLERGHALGLEDLRKWAGERLAPYKIPSRALFLEDLPRNAMGKVTKPALKDLFKADFSSYG